MKEDKKIAKLITGWLSFEEILSKYQSKKVDELENNVLLSQINPMVTVILITFNHKKFIAKAIEGILEQKFDFSVEIIIGDDDSTDGTREICEQYARKYSDTIRFFRHHRDNRIRVLEKQSGIFQIGYNILQARGKYIALLSGDDYWNDKTKLSRQIRALENKKGYSYSWHSYVIHEISKNRFSNIYRGKRIQTIVGLNVFRKLPIEFFNILQEDNFLKIIWANTGDGLFIEEIKPAVIIHHNDNLFDTTMWIDRYKYVTLFWANMVSAFKSNSALKNSAKRKLISVLYRRNKLKYPGRPDLFLIHSVAGFLTHIKVFFK